LAKYLINIRGASASGKTTTLKQFCERYGFSVEKIHTPFHSLPICLINNSNIVVFGDYSADGNCLGADRFRDGTKDIIDCFIAVCEKYNPDIIIYEHMLSSHCFKGTSNIAKIAKEFGYIFFGIQLQLSEKKRFKNLIDRSGSNASTKQFNKNNGDKVDRASEKLINAGIDVMTVNVENMKKESMWKIIDYAIRKKIK
jgi:hypothetical protein